MRYDFPIRGVMDGFSDFFPIDESGDVFVIYVSDKKGCFVSMIIDLKIHLTNFALT
jgi:hypothetical protein